ncbi:MAG: helix-turn-helix transcriptional regulator [Heyndrickxia faecalis]|jgi:putative transcriptional regulator|uniref:helix-turn-helix transcriptional regulator n=1 Tax=Heyndrickxia TaxID=2837504 RepID=UPI000551F1AA|nr:MULTISPECIES: helix-turn-helix transcriptional regulator [Heyndrickxia]KGT40326.1 Cro/Cl family transcriptional regulator [Heyndrickxia coagulans P38]MED4321378.1 helix-turn-helix transcriptional regulator [Weizmannia sp. CD-2023]MED4976517.1 helix-turn-helix transcriptional regulator [Weizmannia sp. CD-2023]UXC20979.1 helix-turn-helix domain-containing protein [Heyndrickxia coagulans]
MRLKDDNVIVLLGAWIKQSGIDRKDICNKFGISANTLSNWCTGKTYPSVPQLLKLCELLNVKFEDIYRKKEENK